MTLEGKVVLITGASSSIGEATARVFAKRGPHVVLAARREGRLRLVAQELEARGLSASIEVVDLADPLQTAELVPRVEARLGRLDVLVNNAGFGAQRLHEQLPDADVARMFAVNVLAPMALSRAAIPIMRRSGGAIINVASVGGVIAHPLNVAYCATKHALVGFSRSLNLELRGSGVRVCAVCPAGTRTEFFTVAEHDLPFPEWFGKFLASPETVARSILRAVGSNHDLIFPSWSARSMYLLDRLFPFLTRRANIWYRNRVLQHVSPDCANLNAKARTAGEPPESDRTKAPPDQGAGPTPPA